MAKAEVFHVVNNVTLDFESEGHKYTMKLLVEDGLIILKDETNKEQYLFLGNKEAYTGESIGNVDIDKPKKKRKRNNNRNNKHNS